MRIYKEFFFEAAHYLPSAPPGTPNARVHGHSFRVRLTLEGQPDPQTGLVLHFGTLSDTIKSIHEKLDHRFLNDIDTLPFPTLEHLAIHIWQECAPALPGLAEVHVSRDSCMEGCIYTGPDGQ